MISYQRPDEVGLYHPEQLDAPVQVLQEPDGQDVQDMVWVKQGMQMKACLLNSRNQVSLVPVADDTIKVRFLKVYWLSADRSLQCTLAKMS